MDNASPNKIGTCALSTTQQRLWEDTRAALLWSAPAFSHIFYSMLNKAGAEHVAIMSGDVPLAATDGSSLILNPDAYFKLNLYQRVFVAAHEILHCVLDHCNAIHRWEKSGSVKYPDGSSLPYSHMLMNVAMDLVINDILIESRVGQFVPGGLHDRSLAVGTDSVVDTYAKVFKRADGGGKVSGASFDQLLKPGASQGKDAAQAVAERNDQEWQQAIAAAAHSAKLMGKLPSGLERIFNDCLNPQVDWRDKIAGLFARRVGCGAYDWRRGDRQLIVRKPEAIYAPSRSGYGCGTVVVAVDTSGSIGSKTLDMFLGEVSGILEDMRPKRLVVVWCDAKVHRADECEDASDLNTIRRKGAPGGGGTSFIPVFDHINKEGLSPDVLVYLTDGEGSFPAQAPGYPVIWGSIRKASKYPFGDVVDIPQQAS